jgi:type I restriction enzyme R subunit
LVARTLQVALSCAKFLERSEGKRVSRYKSDLKYFVDLRASAQRRYAETVDFKQYQARIQKLLDTHVKSGEVEIVVQPVSIFDKDAFQREIDKLDSDRSKALTIAHRVRHAIREHVGDDPAFYKRFSELLEQTIADFRQQRIDDATFLSSVRDIASKVRDRGSEQLPAALDGHDVARAYFGVVRERLASVEDDVDALADLALRVDRSIRDLRIVNWVQSSDQQNRMRTAIEDQLFAWGEGRECQIGFDIADHVIETYMRSVLSKCA